MHCTLNPITMIYFKCKEIAGLSGPLSPESTGWKPHPTGPPPVLVSPLPLVAMHYPRPCVQIPIPLSMTAGNPALRGCGGGQGVRPARAYQCVNSRRSLGTWNLLCPGDAVRGYGGTWNFSLSTFAEPAGPPLWGDVQVAPRRPFGGVTFLFPLPQEAPPYPRATSPQPLGTRNSALF
jgi:hypothetical protein